MKIRPPKNPPPKAPPPWFKNQEPNAKDADYDRRRDHLLSQLPDLLEKLKKHGRADQFAPYLLIRSVLGDRGDRPINVTFWESPDIWTAPGDPTSSPEIPTSHGGTLVVGQPNTVYAHVWNLGLAPLLGVRVEFFWFNPSLAIDGAHARLIGTAVCELSGRALPGSHKLVKCPKPWIPVMENGGHECLIARVSGIGDPIGANEWAPWANRHVAQRNVSVVAANAATGNLVQSLNKTRLLGSRVQLIQLGAAEGKLAGRIVAPSLRVSPRVSTHLLGEITAKGDITLPRSSSAPAGMLAPIHALAHGVESAPPIMHQPGTVPVVNTERIFGSIRSDARVPVTPGSPSTIHVVDLFGAVGRLHDRSERLETPRAGEAHVLRLATYSGDQLVGGYTLVVRAP
jgi:hypothetical protein